MVTVRVLDWPTWVLNGQPCPGLCRVVGCNPPEVGTRRHSLRVAEKSRWKLEQEPPGLHLLLFLETSVPCLRAERRYPAAPGVRAAPRNRGAGHTLEDELMKLERGRRHVDRLPRGPRNLVGGKISAYATHRDGLEVLESMGHARGDDDGLAGRSIRRVDDVRGSACRSGRRDGRPDGRPPAWSTGWT